MGDEGLAALPTRRQFAAEYIGRLFDAIDEREAFGDMVTEEYSDDPAEINMGVLIKSAVTDMRVAYGSPELQGTDSPLNPQYHEGGLNAAVEAEDGIETVRQHIEAVYAQGR